MDHTTSTWDESWTIRDLSGNVVRRLDKVGPTWSFGQDWIRRDGWLLAAALPGGLERHYHLDHLGSARLITQQTGTTIGRFAYLPFGEDASEVSATFPETMRFTGHERDGVETAGWADDLDYMRARYCSPRWGRFLSVDPARDSARVGVPQSWNRYSYGLGNPVKYVDPDGRVAETAWDAFNIGLGIASFADNVRQGNWGAAVLDGLGVVADTAATATPFVPGGAGSAIRVYRAADRAGETAGAVSAGVRGVSRGAVTVDDMLRSAQQLDRNNLTRAGRALQKHGDRAGSVFPRSTGNSAARNAQGQQILEEILGSSTQRTRANRFGGQDIFNTATGRGARFDDEGNFMGFLEP